MNDSRVISSCSVLKGLFRVESSGLLKTFLITFGETNELNVEAKLPVCNLKRSSICLAIFPIRG